MTLILRKTITQCFLERARSCPDLVGFRHKVGAEWKDTTFGRFFAECRELSFGLMSLGVEPGDKVALISGTRFEWPLCDLAILGARGVTVPIYPSLTSEEIIQILEHSEATVAILEDAAQLRKLATRPKCLEKLVVIDPTSLPGDTFTLRSLAQAGRNHEARDPNRFERNLQEAAPEELFTICYTSGTTGDPKGVMLAHDSLMSVLEDCAQVLGDQIRPEQEITLSFLPYAHILGRVESMAVHVFGWRHCFAESMDRIPTNLHEIRPTLIFTVPRVFEKAFERVTATVAQSPPIVRKLFDWSLKAGRNYYGAVSKGIRPSLKDLAQYRLAHRVIFERVREGFGGRLRVAICGGAPLSRDIGEFFQIAGIPILEGYGLTETCAPVTLNAIEDLRFGTVGRPLPEVSLRIAEDGEILVKSRKLFKGYFKAPQDTEQALRSGWFHSGDIGSIDKDGFLRITDRKKDLIVTSNGKNIAPQKIENLAASHKLIQHFVVQGDRRNYLTALVTLNQEEVIRFANENHILFSEYGELIKNSKILGLIERIVTELNQRLPQFETIKRFIILPNEFTVENGELTPSLKVRRKVIAERYRDQIDSMYRTSADT
ncbi:MAG: long-chain fatty acid--CoA ligase [Oligoflexia bacterium]|nr:long-chain fatty acid--CoA ligase [Oligoflexia bacterium]